eukprot:scaffold52042_cov22-Tisochrysis_lutea.AAC.2
MLLSHQGIHILFHLGIGLLANYTAAQPFGLWDSVEAADSRRDQPAAVSSWDCITCSICRTHSHLGALGQ